MLLMGELLYAMPSDPSDLKVFAAPVFRGGRFDDHAIPVDVLPQFLAYRNLVRDLAMALFRTRNNRIRVPAHFEDAFQLKLQNVEKDCAVPVLARAQTQLADVGGEPLDIGQVGDYYDEARDLISDTIHALAQQQALPDDFPEELLEDLLTLGKYLQDDESLEFRGPSRAAGPRYDAMVRVLIESRLARPSYRKPAELKGTVVGFDWDTGRFRLRTLDGSYVVGSHTASTAGTLAKALNEKKFSRVRVLGDVTFTHDHIPQRINDIREAHSWSGSDEASVRQVEEELQSLTQLPRGWADGAGIPAPAEHMPWLAERLVTLMVEHHLPAPTFFPMEDGRVQAVWRQLPYRVEAEFDLIQKTVSLIAINIQSDEEADLDCDLKTAEGGQQFFTFLQTHLGQNQGGPRP